MFAVRLLAGISVLALASGGAWAQTNTSVYNQTGTGNSATVDNTVDGNISNSSAIIQNGVNNSATVYQRSNNNGSFIQQIGSFQTATHQQVGSFNQADSRQNGDFQVTATTQVGNFNSSTLLQVGRYNRNVLRQGYAFDATLPNGELRAADFNTASIDQSGAGLSSVVDQRAASASLPAASNNQAYVLQRSAGSSSSVQQSSAITQESRGNYARVSQYDGAAGGSNNSTLNQGNTGSPQALAGNSATIEQRGIGQSSSVAQNGFRNNAALQMAGGGVSAGNTSIITQRGSDNVSRYANVRVAPGRGTSNTSWSVQDGDFNDLQVYQAGVADQSNVAQRTGVNTGVYADGQRASARAFVSQNSAMGSSSVDQTGDNYAEVVQAFGNQLTTTIAQIDAGDLNANRASNSVTISQYGFANSVDVQQNSIGSEVSVWQKVGSSQNIGVIRQGTGGTSDSSTSSVPGFPSGPTGAATNNLQAQLVQSGAGNRSDISQDGVQLKARVEQYGSAPSGAQNKVVVSQSGLNNTATAFQSASVSASAEGDPASGRSASENASAGDAPQADEFYFAGGSRSPELTILQTNSNNSATIRQFGRGQLARIEQSGSSNVGDILQADGATNATAVLRQTGSNNTYYIVQTMPGQYVVVTQAGTANSAANVTQRGPEGGSVGFTPPPGG